MFVYGLCLRGMGGTLNNRRATSPLVRLGKGMRNETQNWVGTEQNRAVTCLVLKAKTNDRRKNQALSRDEFRGP
ncbi:hypothetical protein TNCV_1973181 [Trichonephila clavipes]|nr:hypothetical protein TNCV_1973181 [Trichonephila clavipes]